MRSAILAASAALALSALTSCIVYEERVVVRDHEHPHDHDHGDHEGPDRDTAPPRVVCGLEFSPYEALPGETFLGYLTTSDDAWDAGVVQIALHGAASIDAWEPHNGELILSITVDGDAPLSTVDLEAVLATGQSCWLEPAFGIDGL